MTDDRFDAPSIAYATFVLIIAMWIVAWLIELQLESHGHINTALARFVYWTTAKGLLWLLPAYYLIKRSGRNLRQVWRVSPYKSWLVWGGGVGLVIVVIDWLPRGIQGQPLWPATPRYALWNMLVVAPLFEELLMRGAILGCLERHYAFWKANSITAALFVVLHLPGWYFMGNLGAMLVTPRGGAVSIFLLGALFGWVAKRSGSLMGAVLVHALNNLP